MPIMLSPVSPVHAAVLVAMPVSTISMTAFYGFPDDFLS